MTEKKTVQLCVRCQELVPQGCCTCGDRQELVPLAYHPLAEKLALQAKCEELRASLHVLLAWCERFLIDDKHLIGSICKPADDAQFRHAIEQAHTAIAKATAN